MQFHRLKLQAIGPFPDACEIDLAALGVGGLFLIEGPTGSGKSTILDAITFALYGQLANPESSDERLHSAHAAPGVEPSVELVFSTGAGDYRIWRQPRYERPKQRGTGTTTQNQQVRLYRLSPGDLDTVLAGGEAGTLLSTRAQEVGAEMPVLTGLTREQFTQTVLLPQGKFATFLRSRPDDRRVVLQQVFGTDVYDRVQKRLIDGAKDLRRALQTSRQAISTAVAVYAGTLDLDPEQRAALEVAATSGEDLGPPLTDRADLLAGQAARSAAEAQAADAAERAAVARSAEAERLDEALRRRAGLLQRQADLDARSDQVEQLRGRLELSSRAAAVVPLVAPARAAAETRERLEQQAAALGSCGDDSELERLAGADAARHAVLTRTIGELAPWARTEQELQRRTEQLAVERRRLDERREELVQRRTALDARPAQEQALETELAVLREDAGDRVGARADTERAEQALAAATAAEALAADVERAAVRTRHLLEAHRQASDAAHRLQEQRFAGMAGEMAADLRVGEACLVCGSPEHPAPAQLDAAHVSSEDVAAAEQVRDRARVALDDHRDACSALASQLAARRAEAGERDVAATTAVLQQARTREQQVEHQHRRIVRQERALRDFRAATGQLTADWTADNQAWDRDDQQWVRRGEELVRDTDACDALREDEPTVAARLTVLRDQAAAAQDRAESARQVLRARTEERAAGARLGAALAESPFDSPQAALAARLERTEELAAQEVVRGYNDERVRVTTGLAELPPLTGEEDPRLAEHREAVEAARSAARAATSAADAADKLARDVARARVGIERAIAAYAAESADGAALLRVSDLAQAGQQSLIRTELATWVLVRRFEEVVAAANDRLQVMSDGRYLLERVDDEAGQRSQKLGLGLQVVDQLTDRPRSPGTLSGGETFYVSLALALGLADIVRAEAGGVDLDTLFIDEGFGSLDPSALENVMTVLDGLRAGGRTVGVISHVADMKDRIPERISVRRRADGCSTLTVIA